MKKFLLATIVFCCIVLSGSCTNKEGGEDLDIITPNDSTETGIDHSYELSVQENQ